ncbi:MAG: 5'/3'-nucleotidase SurE [Treponema sp.]|jgi:5'-nucleotidase|nr:5'/3'-nucleotidase SurE [Treponema sp.]
MNILLTNDDGIDAEGFLSFASALRSGTPHKIYVLAPDTDCSGISSAMSMIHRDVRILSREENVWACSGTPVDCVCVGLMGGLPIKPDLVISGINAGSNIGTDLVYSGTAAAARQSALMGIPGIAVSLAGERGAFCWGAAIKYTLAALSELAALWTRDIFVNVNIPNSPDGPLGTRITFPAVKRYDDSLTVVANGGGLSCRIHLGNSHAEPESGSDWDAVLQNYASVSPVFLHPVALRERCAGVPEYAGVGSREDAPTSVGR